MILSLAWDEPLAAAVSHADEALQSSRPVPFAAAELVTAIFASRPDAESLAWALADILIAEKLKWLRAGMIANGLPPTMAEAFASFDEAIAKGHMAVSTNAVKDLTGKAPASVRDCLGKNAASLLEPGAAEERGRTISRSCR